jgi:class 3 adenylate cyclase/uncharacterized membrane protein affecting hemolysin expression
MVIKHKLALSFSLLLTLVLVAFWLVLKLQLQQTLSQQADSLGNILAKQTADSVTELVLANDLLGLNVVLNQLALEDGVASVTITNVDGVVLSSTATRAAIVNQAGTSYSAPITLQDAVAGYVTLYLDEAFLSNPVARPDPLFYLIIAAALVLATATAYALAAHVTAPMMELLAATDPEDPDPEAEPIVVNRRDEIGLLQQRFAELLWRQQELEEQIELTGVPETDPEEMEGLKAERRMSTLLFVQVANSHKAIELLHPATLSTLLQQFQFYLRQATRLYRGVVVRINGDSALVAFDTRHCQDEHAFDALCCAQLFLKLMHKVAAAQRARKAQALEFSIAVHGGDVYYSPIWKKTRPDEDRARQESVIGKPVEQVAELAVHGKPDEILVSELSYNLAAGDERFETDMSRQITLDTDSLVLVTYSLAPESGTHSELLDRQCQHLLPDQPRITHPDQD